MSFPEDEPATGFILAGEYPEQMLYERGDSEEIDMGDECWFNVADADDVYSYANLRDDFKTLRWLVPVE